MARHRTREKQHYRRLLVATTDETRKDVFRSMRLLGLDFDQCKESFFTDPMSVAALKERGIDIDKEVINVQRSFSREKKA